MSDAKVQIYVNPQADLTTYPDHLRGDMSVFKQARAIQHEAQWIFYLMLKDQGMDVRISREYPREGIFLIHKANTKQFVWNPNLFVMSLQWDHRRDDRAQVHLVSNEYKTTPASLGWLDRLSFAGLQFYIQPIMHPTITARSSARGDRFETLAFIGDPKNLDPAFRSDNFRAQVEDLGMRFVIRSDADKMDDFSDIDAVIAVREIGHMITNKPPVKLVNAWRGGVPALLGREIGYRETRQTQYDYLEVDSVEEVIDALKRLRDDMDFRNQMIANAKKRAEPYSAERQQETWVDFVKSKVLPAYADWQKKPMWHKYVFLCIRWIRYLLREAGSFVWHRLMRRRESQYQK
jgi:hypothetical protein